MVVPDSTTASTEVLVIGAGPAGLLAAWRAAALGRRVVVLEKARRPGVKILISGGTRCNVANVADRRETLAAFGKAGGRFLRPALHAFWRDELLAMLAADGVPTKVEPTGKIFPASDRALDVQRALVGRASGAGAELLTGCPVDALTRDGAELVARTAHGAWRAPCVVLSTGGRSYPRVGTTGDGYRLAAALGHTLVDPRPALVPLRVDVPWVHALSGLSIPDSRLRLVTGDRKLAELDGATLFTHFGLSGPGPLDLSRALLDALPSTSPTDLAVELDLVPDVSEDDLRARLIEAAAGDGARPVRRLLPALPARLRGQLLELAGVPSDQRAAQLGKVGRRRLIAALKRLRLPIAGTLGFDRAEVTRGGVALAEVDPKSMASRVAPGLYLAGEVLDIDGPIGGFNFQAAFSTGWLAGDHAARRVVEGR